MPVLPALATSSRARTARYYWDAGSSAAGVLWQRLRSVKEMRPCATRTRLVSAASTRVTEALCSSVRPVRAVPVRPLRRQQLLTNCSRGKHHFNVFYRSGSQLRMCKPAGTERPQPQRGDLTADEVARHNTLNDCWYASCARILRFSYVYSDSKHQHTGLQDRHRRRCVRRDALQAPWWPCPYDICRPRCQRSGGCVSSRQGGTGKVDGTAPNRCVPHLHWCCAKPSAPGRGIVRQASCAGLGNQRVH